MENFTEWKTARGNVGEIGHDDCIKIQAKRRKAAENNEEKSK